MMVYSITGSLKTLFWLALVLTFLFYLFGISFTTATTELLSEPSQWQNEDSMELHRRFGNLSSSILSLFMAMSGGLDWGELLKSIRRLPLLYSCVFILYITIAIFAVVNVVTGVFLDCAMQIHQQDKEVVVHEEIESKKEALKDLHELFEKLDIDGTGSMTLDEFESRFERERVMAYFNTIKLDVSEARTLFNLLDHDDSNEVSIDEFVNGCYKLMGEATQLDTQIMQWEVKYLKESVDRLSGQIRDVKGIVELDLVSRHVPTDLVAKMRMTAMLKSLSRNA